MATITSQIETQTNNFLEKFGGFIKECTGLPISIAGREKARPAGQYITLSILDTKEIGYPVENGTDINGVKTYIVDYTVRVTVTCYRANAAPPLTAVKHMILTDSNMYTKYFNGTFAGYLTSTAITRFDAPVDGQTFEERAYSTFDFNVAYLLEDPVTSDVIETVQISRNIETNGSELHADLIVTK